MNLASQVDQLLEGGTIILDVVFRFHRRVDIDTK